MSDDLSGSTGRIAESGRIGAPPSRLRVLLVEDDDADAFLVRELLDEVGAPVELTVATSSPRRRSELIRGRLRAAGPRPARRPGPGRPAPAARSWPAAADLRAHRPRRRPPRRGRGGRGRAGLPDQGPGRRHAAGPVGPVRGRAQAGRRERPPAAARWSCSSRSRPGSSAACCPSRCSAAPNSTGAHVLPAGPPQPSSAATSTTWCRPRRTGSR